MNELRRFCVRCTCEIPWKRWRQGSHFCSLDCKKKADKEMDDWRKANYCRRCGIRFPRLRKARKVSTTPVLALSDGAPTAQGIPAVEENVSGE